MYTVDYDPLCSFSCIAQMAQVVIYQLCTCLCLSLWVLSNNHLILYNSDTLCSVSLLSILCVHVCAHSITWLLWPSYCWSTTCVVFFERDLKYFFLCNKSNGSKWTKFYYSTIHNYSDKLLNSYNNLVTGHDCHCCQQVDPPDGDVACGLKLATGLDRDKIQ